MIAYSLVPLRKPKHSQTLASALTIIFGLLAWSSSAAGFPTRTVPSGIVRQLPAGYEVLSSATLSMARPARRFQIVALGRIGEYQRPVNGAAYQRPLLIFEWRQTKFVLIGRNDTVILKADEGGQCDPFLDADGTISVKGRFFTVENGVACGQHWTDFVTFRFDDRAGFVFDNERRESWSLNSSNDPSAEALVRDGPPRIRRGQPGDSAPFSRWRRLR